MLVAAQPTESKSNSAGADPLRVMVVDDSLVIRGVIIRVLKEDPEIRVVGSVPDGEKAVERVKRGDVDVVVLDIEMPVMDGLTALPLMLKAKPDLVVIMASTLTTRNADISLRALKAGAADYIPKPTTNKDLFSAEDFRRELLSRVKTLGYAAKTAGGSRQRSTTTPQVDSQSRTTGESSPLSPALLRARSNVTPRILAIASSTGGPIALQKTLEILGPDIRVPIIITQHMPPSFTGLLASNLTRDTGIVCKEATAGAVPVPGQALIAPGDFHMRLEQKGDNVSVSLNQEPPENFCRPAADQMLRSLIPIYRSAILAVVLTGMGSDGKKGCEDIVHAGGTVVAQDEATSVVWGMPGAVASAGLCHSVLPIDQLGHKVKSIVKGPVR